MRRFYSISRMSWELFFRYKNNILEKLRRIVAIPNRQPACDAAMPPILGRFHLNVISLTAARESSPYLF
jgi:hypothetical protein